MVTPGQIRAARSILGWSQDELARRSNVSRATVNRVEREDHPSQDRTVQDVTRALEAAGIRFVSDGGGRGIMLFEGAEPAD